jgi:hypothetical protein
MMSQLIFLLVLLLCHLSTTFAALPPRLVRDGVSQIWGFAGVAYKAVNYIPVCGTLSLNNPDMYTYISTYTTCEAAMGVYNKTSATSALYDATGSPVDVQVGSGTPVCLCFSLEGPQGKMDMCIDVLSDGTPNGRWTLTYDDIVAGTFLSNSIKALPQCSDTDVAAISSSVYATLNPTEASSIRGTQTTGKSIRPALRKEQRSSEFVSYSTI